MPDNNSTNNAAVSIAASVDKAEVHSSFEQLKPSQKLSSLRYLITYLTPYKIYCLGALLALIVTSGISLLMGQGLKFVIDAGFGQNSLELLNQSLVILVVLAVVMAAGTFTRFYLVSWLGERVSADIRADVFNHLTSLHPSYFETNRSGEITSRLTTDTTLLQTIIGSSVSMALRSTLTTLGGLIMLFVTNALLVFKVIWVVPLVILPMSLFGKRVKRLSRDSQDSIADVGSYAGEIIQNMKTVQSYTQEQQEKKAFSRQVERAFIFARRRIKHRAFLIASVIMMVFLALAVMLWFGGRDVINGVMTAGELAAFIFYAMLVAMGVATISEVFSDLLRAAGATERLIEILAVESLIDQQSDDDITGPLKAELAFNKVSFYYPSRPKQPALVDFSLRLSEGKVIALVGPSGAGKSTVFELLQRFYDPQAGQVLLDGVNISRLDPKVLRQQMAVVSQQTVLFTNDVASNIRYGKPSASDDELIAAAKAAYAHEFIARLPQGYESFLGEQGVRLSGGQKQRIAIARAVLKDPRILMLDEATSALDTESEYHVQQALMALMQGRTTVIIAHRLSTILHADSIAVMDQGRLVAQGDHASLLKSSPLYAKLARYQFSE
ncbi:MAG: ABC transporter transmembrane domain-containing protein [Pseudomonadota bacterium]|nr:ABC transporter transmembrane domain-containing protein [Pseudomonadota bacterium]